MFFDAEMTRAEITEALGLRSAGRGNCCDNVSMENFFGHFKEEALRQFPTTTFEQTQEIVDDYVVTTTRGYD